MTELERVLSAISVIRCPAVCTEEALHRLVIDALEESGLEARHEVALGPRCRIDVMCGAVGIEIKKSRPAAAQLRKQLERYAVCERIRELVVIAPRGVNLPRRIAGKPVTMVALERLWGVSLP